MKYFENNIESDEGKLEKTQSIKKPDKESSTNYNQPETVDFHEYGKTKSYTRIIGTVHVEK